MTQGFSSGFQVDVVTSREDASYVKRVLSGRLRHRSHAMLCHSGLSSRSGLSLIFRVPTPLKWFKIEPIKWRHHQVLRMSFTACLARLARPII